MEEIKEFLEKYSITPEGVDVHQNVKLSYHNLTSMPFQFNVINGDFDCAHNELKSLQNAPLVVHGWFNCVLNELKSLSGAPKVVEGDFDCSSNKIPPWEHRYLLFSEIHRNIWTDDKNLYEFFAWYQNQKHLIPEALQELRKIQVNYVN